MINKNISKITNYFLENKIKPEWMTLKILPILPPALRPIIKLKENIIAASDINYLYTKIINTNNRLEKLNNLESSKKFIQQEQKNLQISVDNLISSKKKINKYIFRIFILKFIFHNFFVKKKTLIITVLKILNL